MYNDFKNQDLTGQNFDGQDLRWSNFYGATLDGCSFVGANLRGVNMVNASIDGTDFTDAIMFRCNQRNATGTAIWTNAKVFGVPDCIPMPGSDAITYPSLIEERINPIFVAILSQTIGFTLTDFTNDDLEVIDGWQQGNGDNKLLTGSYPITSQGRNLYEIVGAPTNIDITLEEIINLCMTQNISFNENTRLFYK